VTAPRPPTSEIHGHGLSAFALEAAPGATELGLSPTLTGDHVIKLTKAGPLAPDMPAVGGGAIDPTKLHDILLEVAYRIH
jgi:hypothetical protein